MKCMALHIAQRPQCGGRWIGEYLHCTAKYAIKS